MNCIIPGLNLKVFARALQALAKVGDDLYMEASKEKLCLIALNLRKTVCVRYYLLESYFSSYEIDENELSEHSESIFCKIHMKIFLPLFKGVHLDKKLEFVKLEYENNNDLIIVKMKYKCDDIVMIHKLRLMEAESLTIGVCSDLGSSNVITTSSLYSQLLNTFSTSDDEITLEISRDKVLVRNYCVGAPLRPKSVRSQVNLNGSEFTVFQIEDETTINFSLKPFRTAIQFAEAFNLNIGLNFEKGGKPLAIVMKNPTFEVNFIVATLNPYSDAQSTMTASSIPAKITQLNKNIENITTEDREALKNENWDDMEIDTNKIPLETCMITKKGSFHEIVTKAKQKIRNATSKLGTESSTNSFSKKQGDKRNKIFELPLKSHLNEDVDDIIPLSPESPKTKKAKLVFGRCFESTFSRKNLGEILAPNSDSE
ncbi:cell cycle checkpoint control protein Rad9 [Leptinotarsa decemlineata]|uniref:cell cycle checkpoint control protein Rad9 n=1 Tax=Leptinotarsa decemlineata TaxID=7539 RepID=UPI000C2529E8|nr:cell cycle checkpoint control protein RAD9A-like [Leptinotarsa decemlineata]XP_023018782.1 cell cycle checkpoint control protein RAD9A-like [Leptinotarsa decemlineata]XP_023018783.1 cell cycle checkpoint control protein RAD9A-like [Leptinotarsa decemlineata]XP_023018784.1 cell cycle checkpoint control protein RAD9A-like [Leptinotarsa decemlineata]